MFLFLNSLGTGEVIVILMVILMFFGSKNIPSIARTMGKGIRQMRDASQEIQNEITKSASSMREDLNIKREIEQSVKQMDEKKPEPPTPIDPKPEPDKSTEA
ncbi:MAG: twin-arginine translocase TatA/TatE family subunit [Crocinitomicaceae bacterium]|nr:twin-arginine translocase TatA/TatE family subunit [Crocinitomicaceae bacterium]